MEKVKEIVSTMHFYLDNCLIGWTTEKSYNNRSIFITCIIIRILLTTNMLIEMQTLIDKEGYL